MAALLRSARLLKFSPSGLIQITRTGRNGPPLSRLYSGTAVGNGRGVCPRQVAPGYSSSPRCVWPYAGVRSYAGVPEPVGGYKDDSSVAVRSKQAEHFDWALSKLDNSVRRTGRIPKSMLLNIFRSICSKGSASGNQALLLLRSCGSLLPEVPPAERTQLAHQIWDKLQESGTSYDVSHYNAMLKVYLQNEFKFSPTEFLAKMEAANVQPNRVTFQRLIAAYCQEGDIEGASTILAFMKSKDLPITEAVFNSLITGHARAGDMESAETILQVMKDAGVEPGPDAYVVLLNAYAEKGDMEKITQTLQVAESTDNSLMDRDIMQVVFTLAKAGHQEHIPKMMERMRQHRGYVPDAINLCLSLITHGQEETAFTVLKTFPVMQADSMHDYPPELGNFFLRHCVELDMPVEKLVGYCKELQDSNLHASPLQFSLYCALEGKNKGTALELMRVMKEQGLPIRTHYFWPLLTLYLKEKNTAGLLDVVRGMQELDVPACSETFSKYILPGFPNVADACAALQEMGVSLESKTFLLSAVLSAAFKGNLGDLYSKLSDPSFPSLELSTFRLSVITGFRKSDDVENMAKITALLYSDTRFSERPAEAVSYLLYNLIDVLDEAEVQAQEDKLRQYFHQLRRMNVTIPKNIYRGMRNLLQSYHVPNLIKDVYPLVDGKVADSSSDSSTLGSSPQDQPPRFSRPNASVESRVQQLELLQGEEEKRFLLKQLILELCGEENLDRALELKQQYADDMVVGGYAALIHLCSRHDNVEEALKLKRELSSKDSSASLDPGKYVLLVRVLSKHGRVEEAVDMLKEMKEKGVVMRSVNVTALFHMLNAAGLQGDTATVRTLLDAVFSLGLVKPSGNLCSPLVCGYLVKKDLEGAVEACMECQKLYGELPRIHDIVVALVEKGDTELLQKVMDFVSRERGEMAMLYDLFFAFLQTGRYREARKVIETPGLRTRSTRLQWFAEKCMAGNQLEVLENMVDMTAKLFDSDRDEMYSYILRMCRDTGDWRRAEAVWTKMQEEEVIPRERTLRMLAEILKTHGQEVPFEVPEVWYEQAGTAQQREDKAAETPADKTPKTRADKTPKPEHTEYQECLLSLCQPGKTEEAKAMLEEAHSKGIPLTSFCYDRLIKALLAEGSMDDAMAVNDRAVTSIPGYIMSDTATSLLIITHSKKGQLKEGLATVKDMLLADRIPSVLSVTRLVQAMSSHGDVQGIQEVKTLVENVSLKLSSMLFVNNTALAHINNGSVEEAVEGLEAFYTQGETTSMFYVFRKVLESKNEAALDKLSAMAERLANHFASYRTVSDLFQALLDVDRVEDAKFMLARCNAIAEQKRFLVAYMNKKSQIPGQVGKIKALQTLIPDFAEKEIIYSHLMKCYSLDGDLGSAKALYEQSEREGVAMSELDLKRLARLYKNEGEEVPFNEPPKSFKFYIDQARNSQTQPARAGEE